MLGALMRFFCRDQRQLTYLRLPLLLMEGAGTAEGALPDAVTVVDYGEGKGDGIQVPPPKPHHPTPHTPHLARHTHHTHHTHHTPGWYFHRSWRPGPPVGC